MTQTRTLGTGDSTYSGDIDLTTTLSVALWLTMTTGYKDVNKWHADVYTA